MIIEKQQKHLDLMVGTIVHFVGTGYMMSKRSCECGCDTFRFKPEYVFDQHYEKNECRNCGHVLAQHLNISKDAE